MRMKAASSQPVEKLPREGEPRLLFEALLLGIVGGFSARIFISAHDGR
jgi:hypothetical protein